MRIAVLGGSGIQGRTAVFDLARCAEVAEVTCADLDFTGIREIEQFLDTAKIRLVQLDVTNGENLETLFRGADAVIDLLPRRFLEPVCQAAIRAGVGVVNTNYATPIVHLHRAAREAGIAILPECGLDPGIDLVLCGEAARRFDELHLINCYCGGIPELSACDNPLKYKVSWVFEGVLAATKRDSRMIRDGALVDISGEHQHDPAHIRQVEFPGLGTLEAIPNGDAVGFTDALGVTATLRETGRYSLRWPGWSAFWRPLKQLGFLSETPLAGLKAPVSPYEVLDNLLGPQLRYGRQEKDVVVMLNRFEGSMEGREVRLTSRMRVERDLETGLLAMAQSVGYPASIAAQLIASGDIAHCGVLSPLKHIPYDPFIEGLRARGIVIEEETQTLS